MRNCRPRREQVDSAVLSTRVFERLKEVCGRLLVTTDHPESFQKPDGLRDRHSEVLGGLALHSTILRSRPRY